MINLYGHILPVHVAPPPAAVALKQANMSATNVTCWSGTVGDSPCVSTSIPGSGPVKFGPSAAAVFWNCLNRSAKKVTCPSLLESQKLQVGSSVEATVDKT